MLQEEIPLLLGYNWLKKEVQTINNLIISYNKTRKLR